MKMELNEGGTGTILPEEAFDMGAIDLKRFPRIVTPIYRAIGDSIDHEATGVLIKTPSAGRTRYWLLTADHVIDGHAFIVLPGPRNIFVYRDKFHRFGPPLDVAICEIPAPDATDLRSVDLAFLPVDAMKEPANLGPPTECKFLGYPDQSVEIDGDTKRVSVH